MNENEEDEELKLSASTLDALQSFYSERDARIQQFEDLKEQAEARSQTKASDLDMETLFAEDWNASQFWYTKEVAYTLAQALLNGCTSQSRIAIVSAPSVFVAMKNILAKDNESVKVTRPQKILLLEYDDRFDVFKNDFQKYDYKTPLQLPGELRGTFDRIIVDPPFLSDECQTKAAMTVQWLLRKQQSSSVAPKAEAPAENHGGGGERVVVCTGERMGELIDRLYGRARGVRLTDLNILHANGLSNEFCCFANFECDAWSWTLK